MDELCFGREAYTNELSQEGDPRGSVAISTAMPYVHAVIGIHVLSV